MRSRRLLAPALAYSSLALASVLLAGCSGADPTPEPGATPTPSATPAPVLSPLTGQELKDGAPRHRILGVKIDNTSSSQPQVGLGAADLVVEELVEGGITRLAAFYLTEVPDVVGPVRSLRASDIGIVLPLDAALVASGGAPQTVQRFEEAGVTTYTEGADGYFRDSSRSAPYNLFMELPVVARKEKSSGLPAPYLPFGEEPLPRGKAASAFTVSFSAGSSTSFTRDGRTWTNTDTNAGADDQFRPATVLVLRVEIGDAGYLDPAGNPVPETVFDGEGPMMLFHQGRVVRGTWAKAGLDAPVSLATRKGPLEVPPGPVWIELIPVDAGGVTITP